MMQRVEVLSGHIDTLLKKHKAAKREIVRLNRALQKAEETRDKAVRDLETCRREALHQSLAMLPVDAGAKPELRKSLDAVIAEIDTILMQLHD